MAEANKVDTEHVVVFFSSPDGVNLWKPEERENIPDWLRDQDVIERLIAGDKAMNPAEKDPQYWRVVEVERPRPIGYRDRMRQANAAANGKSAGGIQLVH